jgi:hypothetical protein
MEIKYSAIYYFLAYISHGHAVDQEPCLSSSLPSFMLEAGEVMRFKFRLMKVCPWKIGGKTPFPIGQPIPPLIDHMSSRGKNSTANSL